MIEVVEDKARRRLWSDPDTKGWLETRLAELEAGTSTPFTVAEELLARSKDLLTGTSK